MPDPDKPATPAQETEISARGAGQRRVNLIWESTQAVIAGSVVSTVLYVSAFLALKSETQTAAYVFLTGVANLVIGFYFGRTNHQRTGGVGGGNEMAGR